MAILFDRGASEYFPIPPDSPESFTVMGCYRRGQPFWPNPHDPRCVAHINHQCHELVDGATKEIRNNELYILMAKALGWARSLGVPVAWLKLGWTLLSKSTGKPWLPQPE